MAAEYGTVHHLLPPTYKRMVSAWLEEDCPSFDYGGFVVGEEVKEARLLGKSPVGRCHLVVCFASAASSRCTILSIISCRGDCFHLRLRLGNSAILFFPRSMSTQRFYLRIAMQSTPDLTSLFGFRAWLPVFLSLTKSSGNWTARMSLLPFLLEEHYFSLLSPRPPQLP